MPCSSITAIRATSSSLPYPSMSQLHLYCLLVDTPLTPGVFAAEQKFGNQEKSRDAVPTGPQDALYAFHLRSGCSAVTTYSASKCPRLPVKSGL